MPPSLRISSDVVQLGDLITNQPVLVRVPDMAWTWTWNRGPVAAVRVGTGTGTLIETVFNGDAAI